MLFNLDGGDGLELKDLISDKWPLKRALHHFVRCRVID